MDQEKDSEDQRASRIVNRTNEYHSLLDSIYESLVDRDFKLVRKEAQFLISRM